MRRAVWTTAAVVAVGVLIPIVLARLLDPGEFEASSGSWVLASVVAFFVVPLLAGVSAVMQAPAGKALTVAAGGTLLGMVIVLVLFSGERLVRDRPVITFPLVSAQLALLQFTIFLAVLSAWWSRSRVAPVRTTREE